MNMRTVFATVVSMRTLNDTPTNQQMAARVVRTLQELLAEALRRGFHGTVGIELSVHDGTVQHIRRKIEQLER